MDRRRKPAAEDKRLDLCGLKCPLPALKAGAALARLPAGAILVVEATDPMAAIDIPHLVAGMGDELLDREVEGPVLRFRIRRGGGRRRPGGRRGAQ